MLWVFIEAFFGYIAKAIFKAMSFQYDNFQGCSLFCDIKQDFDIILMKCPIGYIGHGGMSTKPLCSQPNWISTNQCGGNFWLHGSLATMNRNSNWTEVFGPCPTASDIFMVSCSDDGICLSVDWSYAAADGQKSKVIHQRIWQIFNFFGLFCVVQF